MNKHAFNLLKISASVIALLAAPAVLCAEETSEPTLVFYSSGDRGPRSTNFGPMVIAALWNDGRIVWSESHIKGGPPYKEGRFPREKLESLLTSLEGNRAFSDTSLARAWFGPDSSYTTIAIDDGRRRLRLQSWHESFEQNTNLVATAAGITPLRGRKLEDMLRQQPEEYRRFREIWSEIREAVAVLIPKTVEAYEGKLVIPKD